MCHYDVITYRSCTHTKVHTTTCNIKLNTSLPPHARRCSYSERNWIMDDCAHMACRILAQAAILQAQRKAATQLRQSSKHQLRALPLVQYIRRPASSMKKASSLRRYITPKPTAHPYKPPYPGYYDLELNILYTIPEITEPREIILDIDDDSARWSWNIHAATSIVMVKPVVRTLVHNKPLPALPNGRLPAHTGGPTHLAPPPAKVKHTPHPISLQAATQQLAEDLTPRRTTHIDSAAHSQASELITLKRTNPKGTTHHISLQAGLQLNDDTLTPRRTTHISSSARSQAQEITTIKPTTTVPDNSTIPLSLRPGQAIPPRNTPATTTRTKDTTHPSSLTPAESAAAFKARKLARETKHATNRAEFNKRRHARIFTPSGVPLAPKASLRLSAVGMSDIAAAPSQPSPPSPSLTWTPTVVYGTVVDLEKGLNPTPRTLRRVGNMPLAPVYDV